MKPLVSVIIPTYNRAEYLAEALNSVLAQTYADLEIFVVDDGSTDGTQEAVARYGSKVTYIRQDNLGVCAARNNALRQARGEYIAFLDDDDLWLETKIEKEVAFLEANSDHGFVFAGFIYFSDDDPDKGRRVLNQYETTTYKCLYGQNMIYSTSIVTLRKSCLDRVGFFDEDLIQSADYDLWLRLAKKFKFGFIDERLSKYRVHAKNMSKNLERRIQSYKQIVNKPELREGTTWLQRMVKIARIYHYTATFYNKYRRYREALICYMMAVLYCPYVGYYHWPKETDHIRFTFLYRILKVYYWIFYCLFGAVFFSKKNAPSTTLVDV